MGLFINNIVNNLRKLIQMHIFLAFSMFKYPNTVTFKGDRCSQSMRIGTHQRLNSLCKFKSKVP